MNFTDFFLRNIKCLNYEQYLVNQILNFAFSVVLQSASKFPNKYLLRLGKKVQISCSLGCGLGCGLRFAKECGAGCGPGLAGGAVCGLTATITGRVQNLGPRRALVPTPSKYLGEDLKIFGGRFDILGEDLKILGGRFISDQYPPVVISQNEIN